MCLSKRGGHRALLSVFVIAVHVSPATYGVTSGPHLVDHSQFDRLGQGLGISGSGLRNEDWRLRVEG
jgi:hypothetical protein